MWYDSLVNRGANMDNSKLTYKEMLLELSKSLEGLDSAIQEAKQKWGYNNGKTNRPWEDQEDRARELRKDLRDFPND